MLWAALLILALATPIGLGLPMVFRSGAAWGEWSVEEVNRMLGYAPAGMQVLNKVWAAPIPGYAFAGQADAPLAHRSAAYVLSAVLGVGACSGAAYLLSRWLTVRKG